MSQRSCIFMSIWKVMNIWANIMDHVELNQEQNLQFQMFYLFQHISEQLTETNGSFFDIRQWTQYFIRLDAWYTMWLGLRVVREVKRVGKNFVVTG